jgi:hypothetical protein
VIFENGWGLVRASNTTPVIVTRFEAIDEKSLEEIQKTLMSYLNELLLKNFMRIKYKPRAFFFKGYYQELIHTAHLP